MIIPVTDLHDARLAVFSRMTDAELRDPKQLVGLARATGETRVTDGLFIAESANVVERAMAAGLAPFAVASERRWEPAARAIAERAQGAADVALFIGAHDEMRALTGFERTRGPLAAFYRPQPPTPEALLADTKRVAVLEDITNFTNLGAIFRSAAALGLDAVLVTPGCHDPLYRRAARVSMGAVFQVPWTYLDDAPDEDAAGIATLRKAGFTTAALALKADSLRLQDPRIADAERLALVLGTEGDGLRPGTIAACDHTVMIPMAHGVDSLNVGAAAAIAFWETCGRMA